MRVLAVLVGVVLAGAMAAPSSASTTDEYGAICVTVGSGEPTCAPEAVYDGPLACPEVFIVEVCIPKVFG